MVILKNDFSSLTKFACYIVPLFNTLLSNTKESPIRHFSTLSTTSTNNALVSNDSDDYAELFTMTHIDHNEPTLTSISSNWIPPTMMMTQKEPEQPGPRRYSYGWHSDNHHQPQSSRLASSQSFHDLTSLNFNQQEVVCPNHQEFGYCSRQPNCPFTHPSSNSAYQQYTPVPQQQQQTKTKSKKNERQQQQDRFADAKLDDFVGKLFELCKDQNGCRFLQKKIEESAKQLELVFNEIHQHFSQLMTGKKKLFIRENRY